MAESLTTVRPDSSSTPATRPKKDQAARQVRRKDAHQILRAVPLTKASTIIVLGRTRYGAVGDLVVTTPDGEIVDLVPPSVLPDLYDPVVEGTLTLSPEHVSRAGKVLRFGAMQSADDFVQAVESLASVSIGGVRINWTPGQVNELKHRAQKRGWPVEQYVQYLVDRFCQDIWSL